MRRPGRVSILAASALAWTLAAPAGIRALAAPARADEAAQPSETEPYEEIRVLLPSDAASKSLARVPNLELMGRGDGDVRLLSRPSITRRLAGEGWSVAVIHEDLEAHYAARAGAGDGFGIFHTYSETTDELNRLHEQFPAITRAPFSIGRTVEDREIWAIEVSDRPDVDEDEPEVLFDGVHHAREIMAVEVNLYFARYLCEHYGTDPLVTYLVDNRQIYFVPIVNPDGFVYNETRRPGGGGMWRKNMRRNEGGCVGVDNNRNYPFHWGEDSGSSRNPCDDTYRGTGPASEPENQAMIRFVNAHRFVTHDSFHSVVGAVLIPWCNTSEPAPDDALLRSIAFNMTEENGYRFGQCPEILYLVSGGFIDWAYGEDQSKPRILSFSTEIGGTGFWPDPSERDGLLAENLHSMLFLAQAAGPVLALREISIPGHGGDQRIEPGETVDLVATIANAGVAADAGDVRLRLRCDDPYVELLRAASSVGALRPGEEGTNAAEPFRMRIDADCPAGRLAPFTLRLEARYSGDLAVPFRLEIGQLPAIYADEFEGIDDDWIPDESQTASAGAFVRIDPNPTPYQPGDDATPPPGTQAWITGQNTSEGDGDVDGGVAASRSPDFDLSRAPAARLSMRYFFGQRDGGDDPGGDFFAIEVSPDAGASWVPLVSIGDQASAAVWKSLDVDLRSVIPLTDRVRFRVRAADGPFDGDIVEAGIDDFRLLEIGAADEPPEPPRPIAPADSASDLAAAPLLAVETASDPEGEPLSYGFRVWRDPDQTDLAAAADGIAATGDAVTWTVKPPLGLGTYHWRSFAADPAHRGLYGPVRSFTVTDTTAQEPAVSARAALAAGPNPAKGTMRIRYLVPPTTTSRLAVYDARGRLVRALPGAPSASGWREVLWDGKDDAGRAIPSGSYWVRLWTPDETRTVRVVRVR